jgi:ATP-binding cassette, subfamily F, member 3
MLSIQNLSYHLGERTLLSDASLHIGSRDRIGLIGANGAGKTTLLRILNGENTPDGGEIVRSRDCSIGYLNQDMLSIESDRSILAMAMEAFEEVVSLEIRIETMLDKLGDNPTENELFKLAELQEKYEAMGGYTLQSRAEEILEGIGFQTSDLHRPLNEFSGGWRMRVMLAKLLLESPSLLLLDEPTNHLDLPSIQWVENYLKQYAGAYIVVSHDRRFLEGVVDTIVEVAGKKLNRYPGSYSEYESLRQERLEVQRNAYANQQQLIRQTERFIERFRYKATKARQVQSRIKALERLEFVEDTDENAPLMHLKFQVGTQPGRHVAHLERVHKRYGELEVLRELDLTVERGDKIALIGANGIGKSTLLRIIGGTEDFEGQCRLGHNVVTAFYAQHQVEALDLGLTILEQMKQAGSQKTEQELRTLLGCFLFSGDDVNKKIRVLSGGEKSRVALAKTLLSQANFLLLDEPTNHLDLQSVKILTEALRQYQGTYVLVSHDRQFIADTANKIWYIENKTIRSYPGGYTEYEYWLSQRNSPAAATAPIPKPKKTAPAVEKTVHAAISRELQSVKKDLERLEQTIEKLEAEKSSLENEMSRQEVYGDYQRLNTVNSRFEEVGRKLEECHRAWEDLAVRSDELERRMGNV